MKYSRDPNGIYIASISGGKDSTAMTLLLLENNEPLDYIITAEIADFPEALHMIDKLEKISPVPVIRVKVDFEYYFKDYEIKNGKYKGYKGYGWATLTSRWCTSLKRDNIHKTVKELANGKKVYEYIGIAYDEINRRNIDSNKLYPLVDNKMRQQDNLKFCYSRGFDFEGAYNHLTRISCYLCPFSLLRNLYFVYSQYSDLWQYMLWLDQFSRFPFRPNETLSEIDRRFRKIAKQRKLF
jgi:hypothetical protein